MPEGAPNNDLNLGADGNEPKLYAGKYKTVEDLEHGYKEAQKALSGRPAPNNDNVPEGKPSTLDFEAMTNEVLARGELSEASRERLAGLGIPEGVIQQYVENAKSETAKIQAAIYETAGGEEQYKAVRDWCKQNLSQAERDFLQQQASLSTDHAKLSVQTMVARYEAANGKIGNLMDAGSNPKGDGAGFASVHEMKQAMKDPRYRTDPAYRDSVIRRVDASNF